MPALWSPDDVATRFAPYIEELHDVFTMHGLHYGSPEDIRPLAERLSEPGAVNEELAALVRSMVLREGGSIPRTDLLEIVAIAISGPRMDPAGEELQQPVRQLLTFLHGALRRPWNEPAGEGRLHPEDGSSAEAARELRAAATRLEAQAQAPDGAPSTEQAGVTEGHPRANVIPFGRARAVFSRLARINGEDLAENVPEAAAAPPVEPVLPLEPPQQSAPPSVEEPAVQVAATAAAPASQQIDPVHPIASLPLAAPMPHSVATEFAVNEREALEGPPPAVESDPEPVFTAAPVTPIAALEPHAAKTVELPATPSARPGKFPMLKEQKPVRIAFVAGAIAAALVAAVFELASHGLAHMRNAYASTPSVGLSATLAAPTVIKPQSGADATQSGSLQPVASLAQAPKKQHIYDDYIAPPHSNMPSQNAAAQAAPSAAAVQAPAPAMNNTAMASTSSSSASSVGPALVEVASVQTRPRNPDATIAGERFTQAASLDRPPHPSISAAMMAENLLSAPKPDFPVLAKMAHVEGPVVLHAEIAPNGSVADTQVISGHYLLRHAAEQAVRHWRYRPYQVDGRPVAVSTTITVRFRHPR